MRRKRCGWETIQKSKRTKINNDIECMCDWDVPPPPQIELIDSVCLEVECVWFEHIT